MYSHFLHQLKILPLAIKVFWQAQIIHRVGTAVWIINGFITPIVLASVWITVGNYRTLDVGTQQIITYYFLVTIVTRLTQSWTGESLGEKINHGLLSVHLVRPTSYITFELARDQAVRILRLMSLTPFILLALYLFGSSLRLHLSIASVLLFTLASVLGYAVNFLIQNLVGLAALWMEKSLGVYQIMGIFEYLFNGYLIPVALMPPTIKFLSLVLPFQFILSFPIEIIQGLLTPTQLLTRYLTLFLWLSLLISVNIITYRRGIKKYSAVGN